MDKAELVERLTALKQMGYVESLRPSNTGIGYTLETLLGVQENNLVLPDLGDIEIKTHRRETNSLITLFTFDRGAWRLPQVDVVNTYGYVDTDKDRQALYCSVTSSPNNQGFFLRIEGNSITLHNVSHASVAQWQGQVLIERFRKKMPALAFIQADTRRNSANKEEFWFNEAHLLTNPNVDKFLNLVETGHILIDLRMHLRPNGAVRNHGTGFRIDEQYLHLCFSDRESLV